MEKRLLLIAPIILSVLIGAVSCQEYGMAVSSEWDEVRVGETAKYRITISSGFDFADKLSLSVEDPRGWSSLSKRSVSIPAGGYATFDLFVSPPLTAAERKYTFVIIANSSGANVSAQLPLSIKVTRDPYIKIEEATADKEEFSPKEEPGFSVKIKNMGIAVGGLEIFSSACGEVSQGKFSMGAEESLVLRESLGPCGEPPGGKTVFIKILSGSETLDSIELPFILSEYSELIEEAESSSGILGREVKIVFENRGNIRETAVAEQEVSSLMGWLFSSETEYYTSRSDGYIMYRWAVVVEPGETKTISYSIAYWPIWLLGAILITILAFAIKEFEKPYIRKKVMKGSMKEGEEISVAISLKNRARKSLNNIIVRDFIPPIAKLVHKFEGVKPIVRKSEAGTELLWRFEKMKPREERVVSYKMAPIVGISGTLKLPKAYARIKEDGGESLKKYSKAVSIRSD